MFVYLSRIEGSPPKVEVYPPKTTTYSIFKYVAFPYVVF